MIGLVALAAAMIDRAPATELNRDAVMAFAACVQRRAPDRAAALLASEPGSKDEGQKAGVIARAYNACIERRHFLSFQVGLLRGALAELAFRHDAALRDRAAALTALAPACPDPTAVEKEAARAPAAERDVVYAQAFRTRFARCVADANPSAIAVLLGTVPASGEERTVLLGAGETLMRCMPEGITYHINSAELRPYLLSELYYRAVAGARSGA